MSCNYKSSTSAYTQYLQTMIKLEELQQMTENLDKELEDSQKVMTEIKTIFDSMPNAQKNISQQQNNDLRHEDISQFLVPSVPKLLLPGMPDSTVQVDLDDVIATMKTYAEDLRKNFVMPSPQQEQRQREMKQLDLDQYATSLGQLAKQLAHVKINNNDVAKKNVELESKLAQLYEDVNMFTQMVQAKAKLSESNQNWAATQENNTALQYNSLIDKLLLDINEVIYMLKNKN